MKNHQNHHSVELLLTESIYFLNLTQLFYQMEVFVVDHFTVIQLLLKHDDQEGKSVHSMCSHQGTLKQTAKHV